MRRHSSLLFPDPDSFHQDSLEKLLRMKFFVLALFAAALACPAQDAPVTPAPVAPLGPVGPVGPVAPVAPVAPIVAASAFNSAAVRVWN